MNIERFRHLAEACGAEITRWPASEQAAARELAGRSPEARQALAQARILDAWLDLAAPAPVSDAQADRVLRGIEARLDPPAVPWPLLAGHDARSSAWRTAGFLALMGLSGFLLGDLGIVPLGHQEASTPTLATLVASSSSSIAWDQ